MFFCNILYKIFKTYLVVVVNIMAVEVKKMSFIKTATKSMVVIGQKGYKVGKRMTKLATLSLQLRLERDKQRAYYQEIGEHVHIDRTDEGVTAAKIKILREKIVLQERKIKRLITEINLLKQVNSCQYCGHISGEGAKYCPNCSRPRT